MITTISASLIDRWGKCGEQVRRIWIEGDRMPPGIALHVGGSVHKGAEVNHRAKMASKKDEPLDIIQDASRDEFVRRIKEMVYFPPEEMSSAKKQIGGGLDITVKLAKLYLDSLAPWIRPVMVEQRLEMEDPELPLPVSGRIDVVDKSGWMPEIKMAEKKWPMSKAENNSQAIIYDRLYHHNIGRPLKKQSFEILTKSKLTHQSIPVEIRDGDWESLKKRIQVMMKSINSGIFPPASPENWWCSQKFCGFFWTCKFIAPYKKIWRPK